VAFQTPFISGKDSLNNEYLGADGQRHAIPPTLLISGIGVVEDWSGAVSMDLKESGNRLYLVGPFAPTLGGSHFNLVSSLAASHPQGGSETSDGIPACRPAENRQHYLALHAAMQQHLVQACHDLSEGGLSVAAAEMCIGGRLGLDLGLPGSDPLRPCFGETTGCLLVEVRSADAPVFEAHFIGLNCRQVGMVCPEQQLSIRFGQQKLIELPIERLYRAWHPEKD
jgi:phosphoribosylformylglycinamidine (FGAM) synthase-like enzyme